MQLESSIQQRYGEQEDINREIQQNRDVFDQEQQIYQQNNYEVLAKKMEKCKELFKTSSYQQMQQAYNDIAVGRFRAQFQSEDQARDAYEQTRSKNFMIEEVLERIKNENPDLEVILSQCLNW